MLRAPFFSFSIFAGTFLACGGFLVAEESSKIAFSRDIRPILSQNCFKCHGGTDAKGKVKIRSGLQLISRRGIVQGGEHGPAFKEADPAKSFILHAIGYEDDDIKMPPRGKLPEDQRAYSVVKMITALGRDLGLTVVAEGVETQRQLEWLYRHGCDIAQGWFVSRADSECLI